MDSHLVFSDSLTETNCSLDASSESDILGHSKEVKFSKKRIGPYSFYFKNLIGSGYTSKVYKGIKNNNKSTDYAIKVLKMKEMKLQNHYMLKNEIQIMQELDHGNILRIQDVYHTHNNCYIVTQYCEGGSLDKYIKKHQNLDWGNIVFQLGDACKYLSLKKIIHRDLKPANIFLKNGVWKIGDFGFAKKLQNLNSLVIENFRVGSPLFMPLETLERNMYSAKTDSFALGVIIYNLIMKEYPYVGESLSKLIKNHKTRAINWKKLQFLPANIVTIIKDLCNTNIKERASILDCQFQSFLNQKSIHEIEASLLDFKQKITEQVTLCQFINYLMKNSMLFLSDNHILYSMISTNLFHLTSIFKWADNRSLNIIKEEYILPEGKITFTENHYRRLIKAVEQIIIELKDTSDNSICQLGLQKFLDYHRILKAIFSANSQSLSEVIKTLILHKNFTDLMPNKSKIQKYLSQLSVKC